ncbi:hypothetical protein CEP52_017617, partial [Fusarium oligoseptatum]
MEEGDLTTEEKLALMDLLKGYMTMHGNRAVNPRRRELYREFFQVIFNRWDSVEGLDDPSTLTEPSFSHTSVRAGKQPPRPAAFTARHAGQPVFLGLTLKLEEEPYAWLWREKAGKFVNPKYVEIAPELGKGEVRRRAIKNYDLWENRIATYNRAVVRTLARRRICKWAKHGSKSGGQVDNDDMLGPGVIQELILARDYLADELAVCLAETSISTLFISQSSIIQDSIIINPDISIINIKTAETTTSSSAYDELQRHIKTEPVPRIESGIKRELTTQRDAHFKTQAKASLAEDDDIIFIGAKPLSSAPAPGRCSCGGPCNHYIATIRAPDPAPDPAPAPATIHTPAPAMAVQQ